MPARNICGPEEYFDGLDDTCVHCSVICRPDLESQDFCHNNCPGKLGSAKLSIGLGYMFMTIHC